jgi:hypothetical protein
MPNMKQDLTAYYPEPLKKQAERAETDVSSELEPLRHDQKTVQKRLQ